MRVAITVSIGLAAGLLALPADARQAPPARQATNAGRTVLADLRQETGEASTRLVIAGSAKPSFTYHSPDPLTLVVDIADADSTRLPARLEVATREIESLRVYSLVRGDGRPTARVEVRLAALSPFTVEEAGNDVLITVSRPANSKAAALPAPQKAAEPLATAPVTPVLKAPVAPVRIGIGAPCDPHLRRHQAPRWPARLPRGRQRHSQARDILPEEPQSAGGRLPGCHHHQGSEPAGGRLPGEGDSPRAVLSSSPARRPPRP